jgi:fused signal recognition particle receptor
LKGRYEEMFGGLFDKLKKGLTKTRDSFTDKVSEILNLAVAIDEDLYEELEEILVTADIGVETSMDIIERLREKIKADKIKDPAQVKPCLKEVLIEMLDNESSDSLIEKESNVLLIIGVNGVGKTTSIGKISAKLKNDGKKVLLAAGDTFRAGAIEQLEIWSKRANVDIVRHQEGADPAAVVYDAIQAARARKVDILICDTAGRLHNKKNLMDELGKINRVIDREYSEASKKTFLVLDATTGQNAVNQAKQFREVCPIDGIILTKLDGTAKGGVVIAIQNELKIPVKYIGVGETVEDLQEFDPVAFVDALF